MKRGTAAKVILGKATLMDVPAGIVHGTDVILGGKAGLLNDFGGLVLSNNLMIGKKVSRGTITTVTVRGVAPIILPDAIASSLQAVRAFGGTEQNGTPTPDTPVDIVSNNGALKYSNNLLDMAAENIVLGKYINNSGVVTDSPANFYNSKYIPVAAGGTYTWSTSSSIGYFSVMEYNSNYVFTKRTLFSNAGTSGSITLRSDTAFVLIGSNIDGSEVTLDKVAAINWQFERGASATAYKPYSPTGIYTDGAVETINAHGTNIFNKNDAQVGKNWNNSSMAYSIASGYIPAKKGDAFTLSISDMPKYTGTTWAVLDSDYTYLGTTSNGSAITQDACAYIRLSIRCASSDTWTQSDLDNAKIQLEKGSTATEYQPYYDGGTATAEMLLKVGDYQDVQSILDGVVTRNVGIKVLDGTEDWVANTVSSGRLVFYITKVSIGSDSTVLPNESPNIKCSHFKTSTAAAQSLYGTVWAGGTAINFTAGDFCVNLTAWKQWLAQQYAAGTPVIIIYPLATPTTESVTGQTLQVAAGDNVLEITQASLDGLELEATYKSLVQLTIQEVEDANLNNNVEVTIS